MQNYIDMKRVFFVLALLIYLLPAFAAGIDTLFYKANEEYNKELYTNAVDDYLQVIQNGYESPEVYYNIGNAYFKLDDFPSAILYYEKAKKLAPNDEDINFNLKVANTKIVDKIEPLPVLFLKTWWKATYNLFNSTTWAWITIFSFIVFFLLLAFYLLSNKVFIRKASFYVGVFAIFITVISFILAFEKYNVEHNQKAAIVFTPTLTVKSSPSEGSVDLFVIHEGSKVKIIDKVGGWYEIRIASGSVGWLPVDAVKEI